MPDVWHGICVSLMNREGGFVMTFGGIALLAVVVAVVVIGAKLRSNSKKLQELEELISKE